MIAKTISLKWDGSARFAQILGLLLLLYLAVSPSELRAQLATASVNGTVRDSTGAVIPGANVKVQNMDSGVNHTTITNGTGNYVVVNLHPGRYMVRFSHEGFEAQQSNLTLVVNQTATLDAVLAVGAVAQTVNVEAGAARLEASTAELGTAIVQAPVNGLPLNGRNFTQLLTLTPGASPINSDQSSGGPGRIKPLGAFMIPSVNGQGTRSNYFLLDGTSDQDPVVSTYAIAPIVDDIQEFKVDSHNDQAMFGGVMGGIVNIVTKSGTNQFHGAAWEFLRNSALDSRNPFFASVNPLRQNQFGGNIGGPVILPHYNGKNRTFFLASFEGTRRSQAAQSLYTVPTPAELTGDLSGLGVPIYNPFSTRPDPSKPGQFIRDQFNGGIIPPYLLNAGAVTFAKALFPAPVNTGVPGFNGVNLSPIHDSVNEYSLRGDDQIGSRDSAWARFTHNGYNITGSGGITGLVTENSQPGYQLASSWTHTFGPSAVLQAQFAHTTLTTNEQGIFVHAPPNLVQQVGFNAGFTCGFAFTSRDCLLPSAQITGFLAGGESSTVFADADIYEWRANFSKIHGGHFVNLGFNFDRANMPINVTQDLTVTFTAAETANPESTKGTGSALASFLLGVPNSAQRRNVNGPTQGGKVMGYYVQDQWKVTNRLTVNLGARYDVTFIPRIQNALGYVGNLDLNNGTYVLQEVPPSCATAQKAPCIPGGSLPAHVLAAPGGQLVHNNYDNIQPRIGLAHRLFPRTVIRASYGRFFDNWAAIVQAAQNSRGQWPSLGLLRVSNLNTPTPASPAPLYSFENPGIDGTALPAATPFTNVAFYRDPLMRNPYSDQWNVGIQQQINPATVLEVDYVGSHGSRMDVGYFGNTAVTPGAGSPSLRYPYPYITPTHYDQSIGRANYNALQAKLSAHSAHGIIYLLSYTYSKSIDLGCSAAFGVNCEIENPYDLNGSRSVSDFDLTNIFSASWVWNLPFGSGMRFRFGSRTLDYVIGNWRLSGIWTMTSGAPFTITVPGDIANTGNGATYERPNLVGNPNLGSQRSAQEWFNTAAFSKPVPFTYGNLGRNTMRGDWFKNLDLSLMREFPIHFGESTRLEFRADFFNFTNTPTLGTPDSGFSDPHFAEIASTRSTEREIQFALKLYF